MEPTSEQGLKQFLLVDLSKELDFWSQQARKSVCSCGGVRSEARSVAESSDGEDAEGVPGVFCIPLSAIVVYPEFALPLPLGKIRREIKAPERGVLDC